MDNRYDEEVGLFSEPLYAGVHLCPYCKFFEEDDDERINAHLFGSVSVPNCNHLKQCIKRLLRFSDAGKQGPKPYAPNLIEVGDPFIDGAKNIIVLDCQFYKRIFIDFDEYINSEMWEGTREQILDRDGYQCVFCGTAKNLRVHHITYENIPFEKDEDLITVCNKCHNRLHKIDIARKKK